MKRIELRRHSSKQAPGNTDLSEAGEQLAKHIGASELRGKGFTLLLVSPLKRTQATMELFREAAGDFPAVTPEIFPLHAIATTPEAMSLWEGACNRAEHAAEDMVAAALDEERDIARDLAHKGAEAFHVWMSSLPDEAHALIVGHSPFLELIAYGLFETQLPQLQYCEGFRIVEEDGALSLHTT